MRHRPVRRRRTSARSWLIATAAALGTLAAILWGYVAVLLATR